MDTADNTRPLEPEVRRDLSESLTYGGYLHLEELLNAQHPRSTPPRHDEMLFIIQHQTSELWLKLVLHELVSARDLIKDDDLPPALKRLARVKHIQKTLTEQWSVLATLTPTEYAEFRGFLSSASGFQSYQYRAVEFILGNKNAEMLEVFAHDPVAEATLEELLTRPSVYDEFLLYLHRHGHQVPDQLLERDWTQPYRFTEELVPTFTNIYDHAHDNWAAYEACEELVDIEENFQFWRFRHLKTVERTIGSQRGSGGSSGVQFLRKALELTFFPELYAVRAEIGRGDA